MLREYGEERFAPRIAAAVVRERGHRAVHDLGAAGRAALPRRSPRPHGVPADTRPSAPSRRCGWRSTTSSACCGARSRPRSTSLAVGGRVVVESYHSLEDRLVKQAFAAATRLDVPPDLPFVPAGPRAGPAPGHPRRRARRRRRDRSQPPRRLGPAARRRTGSPASPHPERSSLNEHPTKSLAELALPRGPRVSSTAPALRARVPRLAGAALERARLTVVPKRRRRRSSPVPFLLVVSMLAVGGIVGLLLFNTSMQQASFAATSLQHQADTLVARQQTLQMQLDQLRDPQSGRAQGPADGDGAARPAPPCSTCAPARCSAARPRPRASTRCGCSRRRRPSPPSSNPPAHVTVVQPPATHHDRADSTATRRVGHTTRSRTGRDDHTSHTSTTDLTTEPLRRSGPPRAHRSPRGRSGRTPAAPQPPPGVRRRRPACAARCAARRQLRLRTGFVFIAVVLSFFGARLVQLQGVEPGEVRHPGGRPRAAPSPSSCPPRAARSWTATASRWPTPSTAGWSWPTRR